MQMPLWRAAATAHLPTTHPLLPRDLGRHGVQRLMSRRAGFVQNLTELNIPMAGSLNTLQSPRLLWSRDSRYLAVLSAYMLGVLAFESLQLLWKKDLREFGLFLGRFPRSVDLDLAWSGCTIVGCWIDQEAPAGLTYGGLSLQFFTVDGKTGEMTSTVKFFPADFCSPRLAKYHGQLVFVGSCLTSFSPDASLVCAEIFWAEADRNDCCPDGGVVHFVFTVPEANVIICETRLIRSLDDDDMAGIEWYTRGACTPQWSPQGDQVVTYSFLTNVLRCEAHIVTDLEKRHCSGISFNCTGQLVGYTLEHTEWNGNDAERYPEAHFLCVDTKWPVVVLSHRIFAAFASRTACHALCQHAGTSTLQLYNISMGQFAPLCNIKAPFNQIRVEFGIDEKFYYITRAGEDAGASTFSIWDAGTGQMRAFTGNCCLFKQSPNNLCIAISRKLNPDHPFAQRWFPRATFEIYLLGKP